MFGVREAPTGCNFVHSDEIWKDHVRREQQASRRWPERWGVLATSHQSLQSQDATECSGSPTTLQTESQEFPSYPVTTAREVGLRNSHFSQLEMYERPARGQHSIEKQLQWPREGIM